MAEGSILLRTGAFPSEGAGGGRPQMLVLWGSGQEPGGF